MTFLEAVIKIHEREDLELCDDPTELNGTRSCICVYKDGEFTGKLRWPVANCKLASVDPELIEELKTRK